MSEKTAAVQLTEEQLLVCIGALGTEPDERMDVLKAKLYAAVLSLQGPVWKTREEMAAFAKDWDAKVDADRAKR